MYKVDNEKVLVDHCPRCRVMRRSMGKVVGYICSSGPYIVDNHVLRVKFGS